MLILALKGSRYSLIFIPSCAAVSGCAIKDAR